MIILCPENSLDLQSIAITLFEWNFGFAHGFFSFNDEEKMGAKMNFLRKSFESWEVICMSLREIEAQICPLILLAQMPISTEEMAGYLKTRRNN